MEIKSITMDSGGDIHITSEEGTITVTKTNPSYEGLKLQFLSLGCNAWNWTKNIERYSPLRHTEETLLYDVEEGQLKIPFPNVDYSSYYEPMFRSTNTGGVEFNEESKTI